MKLLNGSLFDFQISQLITEKFNIVINFNQIIITATKPEISENKIAEVISLLINAANLQNIIAVGFNFHWYLKEESKSLEVLSKELFYSSSIDLFSSFFSDENSMFGVYASTDFKNSHLKLDVKPNKFQEINNPVQHNIINFAYNFHFDIKDKNDNALILTYLQEYILYKKRSEEITTKYSK